MDCPSCGREIGETDAYCRYCGSATGAAGRPEVYASAEAATVAAPPVEEDTPSSQQPCQVCGAPTRDPSGMCENCAGVV